MKNLRSKVGLVFQYPEHQLFETTVIKDVLFGPNNMGFGKLEAEVAAYGALKAVGIGEDLIDASPFTFEILHHTGLNYQKYLCGMMVTLLEKVEAGVAGVKSDPENLKGEIDSYIKTNRDLFNHISAGIDSRTKDMDDERKGYLAGHWGANLSDYQQLVEKLTEAFSYDEDVIYKPNSNTILKSKHIIDTYLDSYMEAGKE